ncbi:ABC-2 type transport system ATP-binding protein [Virgibacillus natechei]|uniref:ABC-2 type transport system ATP-binding protein n=1 Tax=Virgibacillus natechei TaxID=1216297 RepID=A0ABS4II83_9BACI|nr:AAA family ATPase [Virgibacillus natechei]MBP1970653.1 ABC-2 type transport system ATP-binding protein [Virgibacillus natechei]UZD13961.1 AAA family ATPase [Virgibacillus natechei]
MKIDSLRFSYKRHSPPVLEDITTAFYQDKLNVIVGLNGAGKTTLLDVITGVHTVNGFTPPFEEGEIVYQLQGIFMPNVLKGRDVVRLILKSDSTSPFKVLKDHFVQDLADREKEMLDQLWDRKIGDMSVGERRWLLIRSISQLNRKLYIFDEPTAGIDPDARTYIMEALSKLVQKRNTLVIMSTHILHELEYINCHINFLHKGKMLYHGDYDRFLKINGTKNPDTAFRNFIETDGEKVSDIGS